MRIAGDTIRRNYLSRYENNYTDKYNSEKKIYSGRQFDRASENPINAARALRLRKSMSEVETYQGNLKTADSIYTNAESALLEVSGIMQTVYEKLVEGAHGTRNQGDLDIIAMSIDNYAEEMVQTLNIDIADRKIFGGLNNDTVAFKIMTDVTGTKYVTYNGVAVNSSNDPQSFPYSGESYLDIGIGMTTDDRTDRIDDQSALPITFNGVVCTGCGMTRRTASIDLNTLQHAEYAMDISVGGRNMIVGFTGDSDPKKAVVNINKALENAFRETPELNEDGSFSYIEDETVYPYGRIRVLGNKIDFTNIPGSDTNIEDDKYYTMNVMLDGKKRTINFLGSTDANQRAANIDQALADQFGKGVAFVDGNGAIKLVGDERTTANITPLGADVADTPMLSTGKNGQIDFDAVIAEYQAAQDAGKQSPSYAINLSGVRTDTRGNQVPVSGMVYFSGGESKEDIIRNINNSIAASGDFGDAVVPYVTETGTLVYGDPDANIVVDNAKVNAAPVGSDGTITLANLRAGSTYAINISGVPAGSTDSVSQNIYFTAGSSPENTIKAINKAIANSPAFESGTLPVIKDDGSLSYPGGTLTVSNNLAPIEEFDFSDISGYANNIMQLVLDSAKLLREGDQDMVARYADLIYAAQSNLSIAIADLGTNSKFIEFNEDRLADVMINLQDKQNDIESTDLPSEITRWKVLESVYNASLQMGSSVLSQSIFNYIS